MTDTTIDTLNIKVKFDNKQLSASAKEVQGTIDGLAKNMGDKLRAAFDVLTTGFGLNVGKNLIEGFASTGANLQLLSQTVNENVETLGTWQQAIIRVGGTAESFNGTIKSLYDRINNAMLHGDPNTTGILNILGINPSTNGKIKDTSQLLKEIIIQLNKQPEHLRMGLGKQLGLDDATLRLTKMNEQELNQYLSTMKKLGVVSGEQSKRALELKQSWQDVTQVWQIAAYDLADQFFPELQKIGSWLKEHPQAVKALTIAFAGLTTAVLGFTAIRSGILALSAALGVLKLSVGVLAAPLTIVLGLLTGIYEIFKNRELIKNWAKKEDLQWLVDLMEKMDTVGKVISSAFSEKNMSTAVQSIKASGITKYKPGEHPGVVGKVIDYFSGDTKAALADEGMRAKQKQLESSGGKNLVGKKNGVPFAFGDYQINLGTARNLGFKGTVDQLTHDSKINADLRDKALADILKDKRIKGDLLKGLSVYNGGWNGLKYLNKNGHTRDYYGENIIGASKKPSSPQHTNNNKNTNVSINNLQLKGLNDPRQFIQGLGDETATGWAFSGAYLA